MTDPHPDTVSAQSGISRYVISNTPERRVQVEVTQWGVLTVTDRDMDTTHPIRQSVFLTWKEIALFNRITTDHPTP